MYLNINIAAIQYQLIYDIVELKNMDKDFQSNTQ